MRRSFRDYLGAIAVAVLAALGGAAVVLADADDAPGGMLIGFLVILGAAALSLRLSKKAE
ncbi:MAG: hypothetical protein HKO53_03820 [Gemmatimonadetes bacterium]|nr:hypothetical protein [Gemmatimonadota bacterium]NNM32164.1 hypothetical protein [Gemmatimonadota bacterium]